MYCMPSNNCIVAVALSLAQLPKVHKLVHKLVHLQVISCSMCTTALLLLVEAAELMHLG